MKIITIKKLLGERKANICSLKQGSRSGDGSRVLNDARVSNEARVLKDAHALNDVCALDDSHASDGSLTQPSLSLLGNKTKYPADYDPSVLETFDNKHPEHPYFVKFNCPEFTSVCPITSQPDFGSVYISYIPDVKMVESKSLKLYLFSFRNHGAFHEDCMNIIMEDLVSLMDPLYIEVWGKFLPRGGISIDPYCNYGRAGTKWADLAWQRLSWHDMHPERVDNR